MNIRAFVNLYPPGVGRCIGFAYETEKDADASASPARVNGRAIKLGSIDIPDDVLRIIEEVARRKNISAEALIAEAVRKYARAA